MGRIRTIKPEMFAHSDLYDAEIRTGLPIRFAWAGMLTVADREGRFKWKPRDLKAAVLPHDTLDFSKVLDALEYLKMIVRYTVDEQEYGYIPTWKAHQTINNRESQSVLPAPPQTTVTRDPRVHDASQPASSDAPLGEGKGREGKGREDASRVKPDDPTFDGAMVSRAVLVECGLSGNHLARILSDVAGAEIAKGANGVELKDRMVAAWREYDGNRARLQFPKGAEKFFGEGVWRAPPEDWPWKDTHKPKRAAPTALDLIRAQRGESLATG